MDHQSTRLYARDLTNGYDGKIVSQGLNVDIPDGAFSVIVGPNACGKSTLLRSLARLSPPKSGEVYLDGKAIHTHPEKEVAKRLGLLPQTAIAPDGMTVYDLVARGRFPHQKFFQRWTSEDESACTKALIATGVADLADRAVSQLSGGQRQRVWIAMALAQETPLLLLDEPTTFLDIAHQIELLNLCRRLNRDEGRTLVAVLHDLNQACRYGDHIIAMKDGAIIVTGAPRAVITEEVVRDVFGISCLIIPDPVTATPMIVPRD
ncbi:ABC transporter ATP-binding protein [Ketogulonicigenium vulgare Y25]|nr:ABC transporter ATP-binding protein [Ketogulonicigenium vulgare]ADO41595.1 ABC transporter ATP-binding protein [Ketogulonicigenium vulgare Y25]ANW32935.1 iron-dicitrate transporter ATP-binding subunit [Ketogulonicigenium vulgare]AOZ53528.1 ABC-type cobalamin/Fe3+-siderophore transport system ATPase component [Ketogulonicigenium vulgare]